jgi:hypothetical protein
MGATPPWIPPQFPENRFDSGSTKIDLLVPEKHKFNEWVRVLPGMQTDYLTSHPFEIKRSYLNWLRMSGDSESNDDSSESE